MAKMRVGFSMSWRARYLLIGGVTIVAAVGLIGWYFFGGRGEVLKPDGGPVVTVMDFGQSFPLDPLPSGWRHRKFWTRSPMSCELDRTPQGYRSAAGHTEWTLATIRVRPQLPARTASKGRQCRAEAERSCCEQHILYRRMISLGGRV